MTPSDGRTVGRSDCSRREFLAMLGGLVVFQSVGPTVQQSDTLPGAGPAGRLSDPERAGRSIEPVTAKDNLAAIQQIEKQLRCTCGCNLDIYTCRTTDFSCTVSPGLHRQVLALYEGGRSERAIIDTFVAEHGQAILMAPPKRGFNLVGYFLPGVVVVAAGVLLTLALRRWTQAAVKDDMRPGGPPSGPAASAADLERLRAELDRIDT
jgi:cytochrome c-type biogenesis protein CcmH/NrfF